MIYKNIFLSAGHGGSDVGAISEDGTTESEINLAVARKVFALLEDTAFEEVLLVGEYYPTATTVKEIERIARCKNWTYKDTILVDIHCDWRGATEGVMAYHFPNYDESIRLAKILCEEVAKVGDRKVKKIIPDEKHRYGSLAMIQVAGGTSCVLEIGSLKSDDNKNDGLELLKSGEGQNQIAEAITIGLCKFAGFEYTQSKEKRQERYQKAQNAITATLSALWYSMSQKQRKLAERHKKEWENLGF
jgi:N-acetylmuramoyl-L-alanine amidase